MKKNIFPITTSCEVVGYGSRIRVLHERFGKYSDITKIDIDFSRSDFPNICIASSEGHVSFTSNGAIEQKEILDAFKSVVKMLEQ